MHFRRLVFFCLLMLPILAAGQDYTVESFEIVPNDLAARTKSRVDNNGRKCGLIKVYVKDAITATDGPVIGEVIDRGMEKWVYVAHDTKQIEFLFKEHMPLRVTFDEFNFTTLSGNMTYVMKLKEVRATDYSIMTTTSGREHNPHLTENSSSYVSTNSPTHNQPTESIKQQSTSNLSVDLHPVIQKLINNMVYVEGGSFMMGDEDANTNINPGWPLHKEKVFSFLIGKYEVSQREWEVVMGNNPSCIKGDNLPVENVSWYDCQEFINKLNELTGLYFYLPTEEEWEFAARGGIHSNNYKYSGNNEPENVAWYDENSLGTTHESGTKDSNELGLYDMSGNVWEWTCSKWRKNYIDFNESSEIVVRGGSWDDYARFNSVSYRFKYNPTHHSKHLGFRLSMLGSLDTSNITRQAEDSFGKTTFDYQ